MRSLILPLLVATALTGSALVAAPPPASAAGSTAPAYSEYVAMGDSFTSSTGFSTLPTTRFVPLGCAQSVTDYPHQVAALLGVGKFTDASCGGATTANLTGPQPTATGVNRPQLDRLTPTTDLVTIGIGGNDAGLVQLAVECAVAGVTATSCKSRNTAGGVDRISARIVTARARIEAVVSAVRTRSPRARVILVNYLEAVPDNGRGCYPAVPVSPADMAWFTAKYKEMNAMLAAAAASSGADLADTYTPSIGHSTCASPRTRYVEPVGIITVNPVGSISAPLHPNQAGAAAQARAVHAAVVGSP